MKHDPNAAMTIKKVDVLDRDFRGEMLGLLTWKFCDNGRRKFTDSDIRDEDFLSGWGSLIGSKMSVAELCFYWDLYCDYMGSGCVNPEAEDKKYWERLGSYIELVHNDHEEWLESVENGTCEWDWCDYGAQ